jgi:hypothetical protein
MEKVALTGLGDTVVSGAGLGAAYTLYRLHRHLLNRALAKAERKAVARATRGIADPAGATAAANLARDSVKAPPESRTARAVRRTADFAWKYPGVAGAGVLGTGGAVVGGTGYMLGRRAAAPRQPKYAMDTATNRLLLEPGFLTSVGKGVAQALANLRQRLITREFSKAENKAMAKARKAALEAGVPPERVEALVQAARFYGRPSKLRKEPAGIAALGRSARFVRRHPQSVGAGVLGTGGLTTGAVGYALGKQDSRPHQSKYAMEQFDYDKAWRYGQRLAHAFVTELELGVAQELNCRR